MQKGVDVPDDEIVNDYLRANNKKKAGAHTRSLQSST